MKIFDKSSDFSKSREERYQQQKAKWLKLQQDWSKKKISFEQYIEGYITQSSSESIKHRLWVSDPDYDDKERAQMMKHLNSLNYQPELKRESNEMWHDSYYIDFIARGKNNTYEEFIDLRKRDANPCKVQ